MFHLEVLLFLVFSEEEIIFLDNGFPATRHTATAECQARLPQGAPSRLHPVLRPEQRANTRLLPRSLA